MATQGNNQIPVQEEGRRKIGRWFLGETLGKGGYSWVKKGYDRKTGNAVALKFMDKKGSNSQNWNDKQIRQVRTEIEALKQLRHPHVMRLLAYNLNAKYPDRKSGVSRNVILLVLEHMSGGELFDILYYTEQFEEPIARTYFQQLIEGLECCHNACIVHRDIKPQNLLLDSEFKLKITDFGLAKLIESDNDAIMRTWHVGTRGYQAPEVLDKKPYTSGCDIFSAGVVLFILLTGYPPFEHAKATDKWYAPMATNDPKKFWKQHRGCGVSPQAKDLISKMLACDPEKRIPIAAIKQHPWYNGEVYPTKELFANLRKRHADMEEKRRKDPLKQQILVVSGRRPVPVDKVKDVPARFNQFDTEIQKAAKQCGIVESTRAPILPPGETIALLDVFTTQSPLDVLGTLHLHIINLKGDATVDFTHFSMEAKLANVNAEILFEVRVWYYEPYECHVVKFKRLSGDTLKYPKLLKKLCEDAYEVLDGLPQDKLEMFRDQSPKAEPNKYDDLFADALKSFDNLSFE